MSFIRAGVVRGGKGHEYAVSLKTGGTLLRNMPEGVLAEDILLDQEGVFYYRGVPIELSELAKKVDVVVNALHGEYGEDGKFQRDLDRFGIPYTGSGVYPSVLAMNKLLAREYFEQAGLKVPYGIALERSDEPVESIALRLFRTFPQPSVIKPVSLGSSVGVRVAHTYAEIVEALRHAFSFSHQVVVEEFIRGKEATVGVVQGFRNEPLYVLPPVEVRTHKPGMIDYDTKYTGDVYSAPGSFSRAEKEDLLERAYLAHKALDLGQYSRSDFIVSPRGVYILETNSLPGFTEVCPMPKGLDAVGAKISHFLEHIIKGARDRA